MFWSCADISIVDSEGMHYMYTVAWRLVNLSSYIVSALIGRHLQCDCF